MTQESLKKLFTASIEYENDEYAKTLKDTGFITAIIYFVFISLEPFGFSSDYNKFLVLLLFCGMYGVIYFLNVALFFPAFNAYFRIKRWYFYSFVLSYCWVVLVIAFSHHVLQNFLNELPLIHTGNLIENLKNAFLFGLIPSAGLGCWKYIEFLQKEANKKTTNLSDLLKNFPYQQSIEQVSRSSNKLIAIKPDDILYIKSDDNYVTVYYKSGNSISKELIRNTLKSYSEHLVFPFLRVHRSYLVNFNKVKKIDGNMQGLQLFLEHTDTTIPVSKTYVHQVIEALNSQ
ncbi:MAG: LytTR family transcriptional regulator [Balneolaceae bacterium]|nr:LytTR family transcriptional regulator [Balneolaceae bacterium]MBO6544912.1 LytTR family transcriptional regulator [Balneolaceae bacterium]MBO6646308.1 LytTR family transcriptional regulator [Balneolaceae bacterium]